MKRSLMKQAFAMVIIGKALFREKGIFKTILTFCSKCKRKDRGNSPFKYLFLNEGRWKFLKVLVSRYFLTR